MFPKEVLWKIQGLKDYLKDLWINVALVKNEELLLKAFIHKSYAADYKDNIPFNERLEFLWDAILGAVISKKLFLDFFKASRPSSILLTSFMEGEYSILISPFKPEIRENTSENGPSGSM